MIKKSLYSLSLKKTTPFSEDESEQLRNEITDLLSLFLKNYLMPPLSSNSKVFEVSFETNSSAKGLLDNFIYNTKDYTKHYDVVFIAEELI